MKEHEINKLDNFICGWYHNDTTMCNTLLDYFQNNLKKDGIVGNGIKKEIKDSLDCVIFDKTVGLEYIKWIQPALDLYVKKYPWCNSFAPWTLVQPATIQYYKPGSAYFGWHTERANAVAPMATRHLVFMTYLNDVTDDGETEWFHQKLKIKPEKGLTVIWPADWCFVHKGIVSQTQDKYIITGWFNYIDNLS
jgi:hypothetical protein